MKYSTYTWNLVQALESASPASCKTPATFVFMLYHLNNIYKELSIFYSLNGGKEWFEKKNVMV